MLNFMLIYTGISTTGFHLFKRKIRKMNCIFKLKLPKEVGKGKIKFQKDYSDINIFIT